MLTDAELELDIVEGGKLTKYRRLGSCSLCGDCCCTKSLTYQIAAYSPGGTESSSDDVEEKVDDWSEWEGFSLIWSQNLWWYIKSTSSDELRDAVCCSFQQNDKRCATWGNDNFPAICRYWPVHPDNLIRFPNCGFRFEKVING